MLNTSEAAVLILKRLSSRSSWDNPNPKYILRDMTLNQKFLLSFCIIGGALALTPFNGCNKPMGLPNQQTSIGSYGAQGPSFDSLETAIFAPKCVQCHSQFASYSTMMATGDVVADNPPASSLYNMVASGNMPQGGPPLSAGDIQAIYDWIAAGALSESASPVNPPPLNPPPTSPPPTSAPPTSAPPTSPPPTNPPASSATYSYLYSNLFKPECISCHSGPNPPRGYDLSTYQSTMSNVVAGNPNSSLLYTEVSSGSMPPGGSISQALIQDLSSWIQNGAQNN